MTWKEKLATKTPKRGAMYLNLKPEMHQWLANIGETYGVPATRVAIVILEEAMLGERQRPKARTPLQRHGHA